MQRTGGDARRSTILRFYFFGLILRGLCRDLEVDATVVVGFLGGRKIEVGKRDLAGTSVGEVEESPVDDGVILHIRLVAVLEDEDGGGLGGYDRLGRFGSIFRSGGLGSGIVGRMTRLGSIPVAAVIDRGTPRR